MLENNKLVLEYETKPEDYKALCNFSVFFRKRFMMVFFALVVLVGIGLIIACLTGAVVLPGWYFAIYIVIIALVAAMPFIQKILVNRVLTTNQYAGHNQRTYEIDAEKFCQKGNTGKLNVEVKWNRFYYIYETKQYFFLYVSNQQAYVIPKSIMSEEEIAFVKQIFKEKLGRYFYRRCR